MNVLVLKPRMRTLDWALIAGEQRRETLAGREAGCRGESEARMALKRVARELGTTPDMIAIRVPFGGPEFREPVIATAEQLNKLEGLVKQAPLHLPMVVAVVRAAWATFGETPIVLCFETAFFTELPERERLYALDEEATGVEGLRRYGYHGIYHEAACRHAVRTLGTRAGEQMPRILSVCLEPRVEIAAAIGTRAVSVTSGATPLEGLPGLTTCGDIDPSIVLTLAEELKMGSEEIDAVLSRESGLAGLAGSGTTLEEVFTSTDPKYTLAREVMYYRILMAAGSAAAALGGLDTIVFSGRSASLGSIIGRRLITDINLAGRGIASEIFREPLTRLMAETAVATAPARGGDMTGLTAGTSATNAPVTSCAARHV